MKKTLTINLNKIVFHIDEDAYEQLNNYLKEVKKHLSQNEENGENEENNDTMSDIEARIAELFIEQQHPTNVISIDDVEKIIQTMGKPSEYNDNEQDNSNQETTKKTTRKKLYRDTQDQPLSGVASGLSFYFGIDVVILRIILVILAIISSGTFILIYMAMWLIIPKAVTTSQKMEMRGEEINIESLNKKAMESTANENNYQQNSGCWRIIRIATKTILAIFVSIFILTGAIVLIPLLFVAIAMIFQFNTLFPIATEHLFFNIQSDNLIPLTISLLLLIIVPIALFIYWLIGRNKKTPPPSRTPYWIGLVLFIIGTFMFITNGGTFIQRIEENNWNIENWDINSISQRIIKSQENGATIEQHITTLPFNQIEVSGDVEIKLVKGDQQSIYISTNNSTTRLETDVYDSTLYISSKDKYVVTITTDQLRRLSISNASKVIFEDKFDIKDLQLNMDGVSEASIDLQSAKNITTHLLGASKLTLKGKTDSLSLHTSGVSNIDALELQTNITTARAEDSSNIRVNTQKQLKAYAFGLSTISYQGNPIIAIKHKDKLSNIEKIDLKKQNHSKQNQSMENNFNHKHTP